MLKRIKDIAKLAKYSVSVNRKENPNILVCSDYAVVDWTSDKPAKITDYKMMVKAIKANAGWLDVWYDKDAEDSCFMIKSHYVTERFRISLQDFFILLHAGVKANMVYMHHNSDGTWTRVKDY